MKLQLYKILFCVVSSLVDVTKGSFSLLVKYKLLIGGIIITLSSVSCGNKNMQATCYDISIVEIGDIDSIKPILPPTPSCYLQTIIDEIEPDTIQVKNETKNL